jgi:cytochrome P450
MTAAATVLSLADRFFIEAMSPAFREDPYPYYERFRGPAPLLRVADTIWFALGHADVTTLLRHPKLSTDESHAATEAGRTREDPNRTRTLLFMDPPEHTRLRAIVNKGFTPRAVAAYEDLLRDLTRVILDRALPQGEFDFIEEIAKMLPIRVLCEILGVPQEDNGRLIEWGDKMIANTDPDMGGLHPGSPESAEYRLLPFRSPTALELFEYGHRIAAERREHPQDDLVSKLVTWEDEDGRRLTEREFDTMFLLLVVAGNETTRQAIAHGTLALMEHPGEMARLRDDPALMRTAADEILRW